MATLYPLSEGRFTVAADKIFHPFNPETDRLNDRVRGSLLVEIQPFLIQTQNEILLLDSGLGFRDPGGEMQIHRLVREAGFTPDQVSWVLVSHLHKDHAGGLVTREETGAYRPAFPQARYAIYGPEWDHALEHPGESYIKDQFEALDSPDRLVRLEGSEGEFAPGLHFYHSGGHSPYHIVFLIKDGEERYFFGGDEAPQHKQMIVKYVAKYDFDGQKAQKLREAYKERGSREGWTFLYYHDIARPTARF